MENRAPAGRVTTHDTMILRTMVMLIAAIPRASPTPMMAPTRVWVVDIGSPVPDAITTVLAVAS